MLTEAEKELATDEASPTGVGFEVTVNSSAKINRTGASAREEEKPLLTVRVPNDKTLVLQYDAKVLRARRSTLRGNRGKDTAATAAGLE
jgi:hypothetical protein